MENCGHISNEYTFWCGIHECTEWEQISHGRKSAAIKEARRHGWTKTAAFGWVCPACSKIRSRTASRERGEETTK